MYKIGKQGGNKVNKQRRSKAHGSQPYQPKKKKELHQGEKEKLTALPSPFLGALGTPFPNQRRAILTSLLNSQLKNQDPPLPIQTLSHTLPSKQSLLPTPPFRKRK